MDNDLQGILHRALQTTCPACGVEQAPRAVTCTECGADIVDNEDEEFESFSYVSEEARGDVYRE